MALNIKDPETDRLARELADLSGQSITTAVREALEERIAVLTARARASGPGLDGIISRGRARSILDDRSPEEILGYGADGLPR
ncbi:type II toxin-antitoxin system VapB family antitoxin [Conexibacter sp. DBS9H8]|uniref:type II toxin-antitoxin system VapB family antitoxin n=1 Tax=Conexibacter sp. DBS9H8 TaxID=2937801 RepID=UPI00200F8CC3|nr:type II toxin-antitoxin system VapB family antitoxin [Conexibacter sp. DBS9H8]